MLIRILFCFLTTDFGITVSNTATTLAEDQNNGELLTVRQSISISNEAVYFRTYLKRFSYLKLLLTEVLYNLSKNDIKIIKLK